MKVLLCNVDELHGFHRIRTCPDIRRRNGLPSSMVIVTVAGVRLGSPGCPKNPRRWVQCLDAISSLDYLREYCAGDVLRTGLSPPFQHCHIEQRDNVNRDPMNQLEI